MQYPEMQEGQFLQVSRKIEHAFKSTGDGLWGLDANVDIVYTEIKFGFENSNDEHDSGPPYLVELLLFHNIPFEDADDVGPALNADVSSYGLLYTDTGCMEAARNVVRNDPFFGRVLRSETIDGTEQGMQGDDYLSCDAQVTLSASQLLKLAIQEHEAEVANGVAEDKRLLIEIDGKKVM